MIDKIIRRIIRTAIESFPIDEKKKTAILKNMLVEKNKGEEQEDVL